MATRAGLAAGAVRGPAVEQIWLLDTGRWEEVAAGPVVPVRRRVTLGLGGRLVVLCPGWAGVSGVGWV